VSRGLGRIQNKCLEALANRDPAMQKGLVGEGVFETIMVAVLAFGDDVITQAQYASVRRALGSLACKGLVKNLGRRFHNNRGRWALPEAAKAYLEKSERDWRVIDEAMGRSPKRPPQPPVERPDQSKS
jgi:hypothetical protein